MLPGPFASFSATLRQLSAWYGLLTLHFNIKGCTYRTQSDTGVLTVYSGAKRYEDLREARRHEFLYTVPAARHDYLHIVITSADGPLDTYDYRVEAEAMPLGQQTFAYVRFTYRYRVLTRMMSFVYFMTAGRDKVGFSVVRADKAGTPIKGRGGAMERSVMRYYLGLQALIESHVQPEAQRFQWRVQRWYTLTDTYRRQLYELDEEEYLDSKRRERVGWAQLQAEIDGKKVIYGARCAQRITRLSFAELLMGARSGEC
jgi:hypothetical protein